MGMDNTYTPLTVSELAELLGHSGTDALRKRWKQVLPTVQFSSKHLLEESEYLALVGRSVRPVSEPRRVPLRPSAPPSVPAPEGTENTERNPPLPAVPPTPVPPLSVPPLSSATETTQPWIVRNGSVAALSSAVLLLVTASVIAVGEVIRESSPIGWFAFVVAAVICAAPLIILTAGAKLDQRLAYATMSTTLLIEIFCNAVAINRHTTKDFVGQVYHTTAMSDIQLAWGLGIGLPILALLLEISLLNIVKK